MTATAVAAVVLNWRDTAQTMVCVRSLIAESLIEHVFVVDNEANGELRDALAGLSAARITLVEAFENRGFSAGVNLGLRAALDADYASFLMINNDAVLSSGSLAHLLTALSSSSDVAAVAPKIVNADGSVQSLGSRLNRVTYAIDPFAAPGHIDYLTWACVLLSRETLETVGLLDERYFMYWEDVDYGFRIQAVGGKQLVVPEAVVSHNISSSHGNAGSKVVGYSALGLSRFGHSQGGSIRVAALVRLWLRAAKLVLRGNFKLARNVMGMWAVGRTNQSPAYLLFSRNTPANG